MVRFSYHRTEVRELNKAEIRRVVLQAVADAAGLSGEEANRLTDETRPIGGIEGFDSYSGVEATTAICHILDRDLPNNFNPFIHSSDRRAASIAEVVEAVFAQLRGKVGSRGR